MTKYKYGEHDHIDEFLEDEKHLHFLGMDPKLLNSPHHEQVGYAQRLKLERFSEMLKLGLNPGDPHHRYDHHHGVPHGETLAKITPIKRAMSNRNNDRKR